MGSLPTNAMPAPCRRTVASLRLPYRRASKIVGVAWESWRDWVKNHGLPRPPTQNRINREDLVRLHGQLLSDCKIGKQLGVSSNAVCRMRKVMGLQNVYDLRAKRVVELVEENDWTQTRAGAELGMSVQQTSNLLRRRGMSTYRPQVQFRRSTALSKWQPLVAFHETAQRMDVLVTRQDEAAFLRRLRPGWHRFTEPGALIQKAANQAVLDAKRRALGKIGTHKAQSGFQNDYAYSLDSGDAPLRDRWIVEQEDPLDDERERKHNIILNALPAEKREFMRLHLSGMKLREIGDHYGYDESRAGQIMRECKEILANQASALREALWG